MHTHALQPFTKLVLIVSGAVQAVMALAGFAAPDLTRAYLSPSPDPPTLAIYYVAGFYLAGAVAAFYALRENTWGIARAYLASAFVLIASFLVITIVGALTPPGVQPISWAYIALSAIYLPVVAWVWRQQSARMPALAAS
jgi:hypothetical protein